MKWPNTGRKESLRVETGQHGLSRLSQAFFMFSVAGRHGSVRANQELDAGPQGSEQPTIHSVNTVTQPDFEPRPYGIKTVSACFHPCRPAL